MVTLILTLTMCALLFLMIWSAMYFYPWTGLLRFFPKSRRRKAAQVTTALAITGKSSSGGS